MTLAQQLAALRRSEYVRESLVAELAGIVPDPVDALPLVLIVDAAAERAEALAGAVEPHARAHTTAQADEALRLALDLRPELVVVGPEPEGLAQPELVRELARTTRPAGVVLVAVADSDAGRAHLLAAGAHDVLAAAAEPGELRSRLGLLLEHGAPAAPARGGGSGPRPLRRRRRRRCGRRRTRPDPGAAAYSTVTVFARLRGWSTLRPRRRAIR